MRHQLAITVAGAGFGGIGMAARLLRDGHRVTVLEREGRNTTNWPEFTFTYRRMTHRVDPDLYTARDPA